MDPFIYIVYAVAAGVTATGLAFVGWRWWRSAPQTTVRAMAAVPATRIADAAEGALVRVVGKVLVEGEPLRSPVDDRPCAYFVAERWRASVLGSSLGNMGHRGEFLEVTWTRIRREVGSRPFLIDDGSGRARVTPHEADVVLERESEPFEPQDEAEAKIIRDAAWRAAAAIVDGQEEWRVHLLEVGETAAVVGIVSRAPAPPGADMQIVPPAEGAIRISDYAASRRR